LKSITLFEELFQLIEPDEINLLLYAKACLDWDEPQKAKAAVEKSLKIKETENGLKTLEIVEERVKEREKMVSLDKEEEKESILFKRISRRSKKRIESTNDVSLLNAIIQETENLAEKRIVFEKILSLEPDNFDALLGLSNLYALIIAGTFFRRKHLLKKAIELDPTNHEQWSTLAIVYYLLDIDFAIMAIEHAIELDSDNDEYKERLKKFAKFKKQQQITKQVRDSLSFF
jgi:tetratricopeptide (TPR) repeat protein